MYNDELQTLVTRYLQGAATEAEKQQLMDWYRNRSEETVYWYSEQPDEASQVKKRMLAGLQAHIQQEHRVSKRNATRFGRRFLYQWAPPIAAMLVLAVGLVVGLRVWNNVQKVSAPTERAENRYIVLPDGSKVVLRYGSQLQYPKQFDGDTREVTLVGEAFFDVAHNKEKPFIIHTGQVKTVVLGTAFNIQAFPEQEQVTVSVTRGKVRVEDEQKVLAVLTPDQQIVYHPTEQISEKHIVEATTMVEWAKEDMSFDALPFSTLAERLERRYNVDITFKNKAMEGCPISGRFTGTESLEQVLNILCGTRNASYTLRDGVVQIDGEGCLIKTTELLNQ